MNSPKKYQKIPGHSQGLRQAVLAVHSHLVDTYWKVGQYIVEFEQQGAERAVYGKGLLENLSKDLSLIHGKGFSLSNLKRMRQFYTTFPIGAEVPHQLNWTHLVELLKIDDPLERSFYLNQSINEKWSTTELIRQKKSSIYLRLAASRDKEGILQLSRQGQIIENPSDLIREPVVMEFLKIPEAYHFTETELEEKIIGESTHRNSFGARKRRPCGKVCHEQH